MTLELDDGRQVHPITRAELHVRPGRVLLRLKAGAVLEATTSRSLRVEPSADIWLKVAAFDPATFVGSRHVLRRGEVGRDLLAHLYCYDHQPVDDNEVRVLARRGDAYHVRWTGSVEDPDFYDGSKPRARLVVDGWFRHED